MECRRRLWPLDRRRLDVEYLGSHSIHLDRSFYDNQPLTPGPPGTLNARRPNQLFGEIRKIQNDMYSNYNALTVVLRQRTYHQVAGQVSYTWPTTWMSPPTPTMAEQLRSNSIPPRTMAMPTGTFATAWLGSSPILFPHSMGPIFWFVKPSVDGRSTGSSMCNPVLPFNVTLSYQSAGASQGTQRPNFVHATHANCGLKNYIHNNATPCIDPTAYTLPANISGNQYAFGNSREIVGYGPGFSYQNISLFKNFDIYERMRFQFRAEAFNVFNHPSAGTPNAVIGTSSAAVSQPVYCDFGTVTSV